jgi:NADH-quinone oxidoreductase subunit K
VVLFSIEIMLNAANLNFIAFWRFSDTPDQLHGPLFTLFTIAAADAEVAVGLALVIAVYRHFKTVDLEQLDTLKEE